MELILPATMASDSASHARTTLASSSAALRDAWRTPRRISSWPCSESPRNNGPRPPSILGRNAGHHHRHMSWKNPTMKLARKMQHQWVCQSKGKDEGCHSQRTYRRIRTDHHHEQRLPISPHTSEMLVHRHVLFQDLLRRVLASVVLAGHKR